MDYDPAFADCRGRVVGSRRHLCLSLVEATLRRGRRFGGTRPLVFRSEHSGTRFGADARHTVNASNGGSDLLVLRIRKATDLGRSLALWDRLGYSTSYEVQRSDLVLRVASVMALPANSSAIERLIVNPTVDPAAGR